MPKDLKEAGDKETMRRVDEALKRAFSMPHKPHEPLKKSKAKVARRKARQSKVGG